MFANARGLKRLVEQVGASRLVVVKLLSGNVYKSIEQVRMEINPLMGGFVQEMCPVN